MQLSIAVLFAAYAAQYADARQPLMRRGADVAEQRTIAANHHEGAHVEVQASGSSRVTLHSNVQHQQTLEPAKVSNHVDQAPIRAAVTWDGKTEALSKLGLTSNASLMHEHVAEGSNAHLEDKKLADKVHELHELLVDHDAEDDAEDVLEVEELFGHTENKKLSQLHTWGRRRKDSGVPSCDEIEGKKSCRRRWFNGCPAAEDSSLEPDAKPACRRRWFRCPRTTPDEPMAIPDNWYASSSEVNDHNVALGAMLDSLNGMWTQQKKPYPDEYKRPIYAQFAEKGNISDPVVIDAGLISTAMFEWMFRLATTNGYPQQPWLDPWGYKQGIGKMYDESYNQGKFENGIRAPMPADAWPVSSNHKVNIIEPCNTMSNLAFYQAGQYVNERTWPWKEEDTAMLVAGFGAMGAGSVFFHGTGLKIGHWNDAIGIDIVTWGLYELMVTAVLEVAQPSEEDKTILLKFGGMAQESAIEAVAGLTDLFSQPYDQWIHKYIEKVKLPAYTMSIAGMVLTTLWLFHDDHEYVLGQVGWGPEKQEELLMAFGLEGEMFDFLTKQYYPALQRSLDKTYICGIDKATILERFVKFVLTFIDAFLYQEQVLRGALGDSAEAEMFEKHRKTFQDFSQVLLDVFGASNDLIPKWWDNYDGHAESYCDMYTTHYKWHERAADGLLQMVELVKTVTKSLHPVKEGSNKHDMRCYKGMYCAAEKTSKKWYDTMMNPMEWR